MKTCCRCNGMKPLSQFHVDNKRKDRRQPYCKSCQSKERLKYHAKYPHKAAYNDTRKRARKIGVDFDLTYAQYENIIESTPFCPMLGLPLERGGDRYTSPSIDRIDNTKGYVLGNIRCTSTLFNNMKGKMSDDELVRVCRKIIKSLDL